MIKIVKRNGKKENFSQGIVALAVFKSIDSWFKSENKSPDLNLARNIGDEVSVEVLRILESKKNNEFSIEEIQEVVLICLAKKNEKWSEHYLNYKLKKDLIRRDQAEKKDQEKVYLFKKNGKKDISFKKHKWEEILSGILKLGVKSEWTVSEWVDSVKDEISITRDYEEFVSIHLKRLLGMSMGRGNWLDSAGSLVIERWSYRVTGRSWLMAEEDYKEWNIQRIEENIIKRLSKKRWGWIANAFEIKEILKILNEKALLKLGFHGVSILEKKVREAGVNITLEELMIYAALAFARQFDENHVELTKKFLMLLMTGKVVVPVNVMISMLTEKEIWEQEWAIQMEDDIGSIYETLKQMAIIGKDGGGLSIDLSGIRASGDLIGRSGNKSGGVIPVLNLMQSTTEMLTSSQEKEKSRIFLSVEHPDFESFLSACKRNSRGILPGIILSDFFMKQVINGGEWHFISPKFLSDHNISYKEAFNRLESRKMKARDVFKWIVLAIQANPSFGVFFKDSAFCFEDPNQSKIISSRFGSLIPYSQGSPTGLVEFGVNIEHLSSLEIKAIVKLLMDLFEHYKDKFKIKKQLAIIPLGIRNVHDLKKIHEEMINEEAGSGIWGEKNPFQSKVDRIKKSRGGINGLPDAILRDLKVKCAKFQSGVWSISYREEYLAITKTKPAYMETGYVASIKFDEIKINYTSGGEALAMKDQVSNIAEWQILIDQSVCWDARLKDTSEGEIENAIKWSWISGLMGIRSFVNKNTTFIP